MSLVTATADLDVVSPPSAFHLSKAEVMAASESTAAAKCLAAAAVRTDDVGADESPAPPAPFSPPGLSAAEVCVILAAEA